MHEAFKEQVKTPDELVEVRNALVSGLSRTYFYRGSDISTMDPECLKQEIDAKRMGLNVRYEPKVEIFSHIKTPPPEPTCVSCPPHDSPYSNPLVAYFDMAIEKESGFSLFEAVKARRSPELGTLSPKDLLNQWRSEKQASASAESTATPSAPAMGTPKG